MYLRQHHSDTILILFYTTIGIVNVECVQAIHKTFRGRQTMILSDSER